MQSAQLRSTVVPLQWLLVGLDVDLMGSSVDPSHAAVWLPGQDPTIGNHTPAWVPRFVEQ